MAVYAFLLSVFHIPGWTGMQMLSGYSFLSATLPFFLLRKLQMTLGHWLGVIFLAYAAGSLAWTSQPLTGIEYLWHWLVLTGAFCLGHRLTGLRAVFLGLGLGVSVSGVVGLFQLAGYAPVASIPTLHHAVSGLFFNPNALSETAAIVLVGLLVYRLWWLVPGVAATMALGQGRTALVAVSATLVLFFVPQRWRFPASLAGLGAVLLAFMVKDGADAVTIRFEAIAAAFADPAVFGHGVGSFGVETARAYFEHLHNDYLEAVYEFGLGAIPLFALLVGALVRESQIKPVLVCFLVVCGFSFPANLPVTGFVAALVAGHLYRCRALVWHRGVVRRRLVAERVEAWGYQPN